MPVRVPGLTTRVDQPPQSWLRHGRHAHYPNGMTSWRAAVTLALGRCTGLAILKDAGIQCSHGIPSTEAAARTVDAAVSRRGF